MVATNINFLGNVKQGPNIRPAQKQSSWRFGLYTIVNGLFLVLIIALYLSGNDKDRNPSLYLVLLFAICSSPLLFVRETNGRYCILLISCPILFLFYGSNDILNYFINIPSYSFNANAGLLSKGEVAILLGVSIWLFGYVIVSNSFNFSKSKFLVRDWKIYNLIWVGFVCVAVGLCSVWVFHTSSYGGRSTLPSSNIAPLIILGRMIEPVGAVMLSYAYLKTKKTIIFFLIATIALIKLPLGIILDSKEIGVSFIAIFILSKWLYDGKVPIHWIVAAIIVVTFYFPISYAYRDNLGTRQLSVAKSLDRAQEFMEKALDEKKRTNGVAEKITSFTGRTDLKNNIEIIVSRVGNDVPYQNGNTLVQLPYFLIPRFLIDKPSVSVGQLFNRQFKISANPDTHISTSFLGELYWNFSWIGLMIGMLFIGMSMGLIGKLANIQQHKSVARLLILVSAIYLLAFRFETGLAQQYILFIRSSILVILVDLIFREGRKNC